MDVIINSEMYACFYSCIRNCMYIKRTSGTSLISDFFDDLSLLFICSFPYIKKSQCKTCYLKNVFAHATTYVLSSHSILIEQSVSYYKSEKKQ